MRCISTAGVNILMVGLIIWQFLYGIGVSCQYSARFFFDHIFYSIATKIMRIIELQVPRINGLFTRRQINIYTYLSDFASLLILKISPVEVRI